MKQSVSSATAAWVVGIGNMVLLGLVSIVFIAIPDSFIGFFIDGSKEPIVMQSGVTCLRMVSFGFLVYAMGMVMINSIEQGGIFLSLIQNETAIRIPREALLAPSFNVKQLML